MKNNGRWSLIAVITLCLGLCASGCQRSSENENTSKVEKSAPTPVPVQRTDVRITGLMIGTGLSAGNEIMNPGSKYRTGDSIYALVRTSGSGPEATIKLRCEDKKSGAIVFEESKKITPDGETATTFTLTAAKNFSAGEYRLTGLLDEYPAMAVGLEVAE